MPIPYWIEGAADVAETTYIPFDSRPAGAPHRPKVMLTPGSQLPLFASTATYINAVDA